MKEIERTELAVNNGTNGKPLWVAYEGRVFDLSESGLWEGGSHMGSHNAGGDLTEELGGAPHGPEMLERFPEIGVLKDKNDLHSKEGLSTKEETSARSLPDLFTRFPILKRHPHPMTVHFPIVLGVFAPLLIILYFIFDNPGFELASFYCLGAGFIFIPIAMITGYITWRVNYGGHPIRAVTIKKVLSVVLLVIDSAAFAWRFTDPGIPHISVAGAFYFLLVFLLMPIVIVTGWFGATLTFPLAKPKG
jgi:predicted heme/steroid binding protein/uncharacterized membrane protein